MSLSDPVGYSPSDFFYVSALANNRIQDINPEFCQQVIGNTNGNSVINNCNLQTNLGEIDIGNCVSAEICQNMNLAKEWTELQTNHSGSTTKLEDTQITSFVTSTNTVNLIVGIGLITWLLSKDIIHIFSEKK